MLKKSNQKGFTIIQVLIVLAIAGLIMLIVFLAVPALQRNSRNTQIKNDAQLLSGGVGDHRANYNGTTPAVAAGTGTINLTGPAGSTTQVKINGSTNVILATTAIPTTTSMNPGTLYVGNGRNCSFAVSSRSVAIWFETETSNGNGALQCIEG